MCEVHVYTTGCVINIGEIEAEKVIFDGSILALIIWYEKKCEIIFGEYEYKTTQMCIPSAPEN